MELVPTTNLPVGSEGLPAVPPPLSFPEHPTTASARRVATVTVDAVRNIFILSSS